MSTNQTPAARFVLKALVALVVVSAIKVVLDRIDPPAAAQGSKSKVERTPASARVPVVDEYYLVKTDWIGPERSIRTIRHLPTGSCYILVHPTGDALMPVEKDRCMAVAVPIEK